MASKAHRSVKTSSILNKLRQRFQNFNANSDATTSMLQSMINSPIDSDVLFLIGNKSVPVNAHSKLLSNAGTTFYEMFSTKATSYPPIALEEYTPEEFLEFLWFVYCQQCSIDEDNAYYMCRAAVRFGVTDLFPHVLRWMVERSPEERPLLDTFFARQMTLPDELNKAFAKIFRLNPLEFTKCRNLDTSATFYDSYAHLLEAIQVWMQWLLEAERPVVQSDLSDHIETDRSSSTCSCGMDFEKIFVPTQQCSLLDGCPVYMNCGQGHLYGTSIGVGQLITTIPGMLYVNETGCLVGYGYC